MNESIKKMYEQEPKTWYAKIIVALIVAALLLLRVVEVAAAPCMVTFYGSVHRIKRKRTFRRRKDHQWYFPSRHRIIV